MRFCGALVIIVCAGAVARADLEPAHKIDTTAGKPQREAAAIASDAAEALGRGDATAALAQAERAIGKSARDPWAHYVRAEALVRLGRLDDALPEYRVAEGEFARDDRWSRSIALWGRANAFHQVGRCADAKSAYADYIAFVKNADARAAALAQARIDDCRLPWVNPLATAPVNPTANPPAATP
ncbi:MAG TPA: tetratricopeptide repeat protein [Polyangia bacterium]|nr:tetratricopeptide repeat protein [Polyangia bacterium]